MLNNYFRLQVNIFLLFIALKLVSASPKSLVYWKLTDTWLGLKRSKRETDSFSRTVFEIKNAWECTSIRYGSSSRGCKLRLRIKVKVKVVP